MTRTRCAGRSHSSSSTAAGRMKTTVTRQTSYAARSARHSCSLAGRLWEVEAVVGHFHRPKAKTNFPIAFAHPMPPPKMLLVSPISSTVESSSRDSPYVLLVHLHASGGRWDGTAMASRLTSSDVAAGGRKHRGVGQCGDGKKVATQPSYHTREKRREQIRLSCPACRRTSQASRTGAPPCSPSLRATSLPHAALDGGALCNKRGRRGRSPPPLPSMSL